VIVIASVLPLALYENALANRLLSKTSGLATTIRAAIESIKSGMGLDPAILGTLSSAQAPLLSLQEQLYRGLYILCGFCFAIVAVLISINLFSLILVFTLRRHVKETQKRCTMQAKAISFQQAEEIKVEVNDLPALPARSRASMQWQTTSDIVRLSHAGSESAKPFQVSSGEAGEPLPVMQARSSCVLRNDSDIALVRLASDLTYAVPLVILMCAALAATLAYLVHIKLSMKDWPTTEALNDSFGWIWLFFSILTIGFLSVNLCKAWRSGKAASDAMLTVKEETTASHTAHFVVSLDRPQDMQEETKG